MSEKMYSFAIKNNAFMKNVFVILTVLVLSLSSLWGQNESLGLKQGYTVRDTVVRGDTCWVCGSYWRETGQWKYSTQGFMYWEVLHTGFVGYMMMQDLASANCRLTCFLVPNTYCLNKMVLHHDGISAIGERDGDQGIFAEMTRIGSSQMSCHVGMTTLEEEQFKDITYSGDKIVVLSRFNNPQHVMYYKHGIGLRYGTPGSFLPTSRNVYCYSTRDVYGDSRLDFASKTPLFFEKSHRSKNVAVGYVCNPEVPMDLHRGETVFFIFDSENGNHPRCVYNHDGQSYSVPFQNVYWIDSSMATIGESVVEEQIVEINPEDVFSEPSGTDIPESFSTKSLGIDSLIGLSSRYGAFDSYQECNRFLNCPVEWADRNYFWFNYYMGRGDSTEVFVTKAVTDHRLAIKGIAVMKLTSMSEVNPGQYYPGSYNMDRVADEEIMIWNGDTLTGQMPSATATWKEKPGSVVNVAVPQCLLTMDDSLPSQYLHFGLTEVCFDRAVGVDSVFFIGGTMKNNAMVQDIYGTNTFLHSPTLYPYIAEQHPDHCAACVYEPGHYVGSNMPGSEWQRLGGSNLWSGPFFVILDTGHYRLTVEANDSTRGMVTGSGVYEPLEEAIVEATPAEGYRFARWGDGVRANPRVVEVACDTTVTAIFLDENDTTGLALNSPLASPHFTLHPNPVQEELTVTTTEEGPLVMKLYDTMGHMLLRRSFSGQARVDVSTLAAGQYYLMVTGSNGARIEPFVKR